MRILAALLLSLGIAVPASAALLVAEPSKVCAFLNDIGLATRGWKNRYDDIFGCSSEYKELGSGYPLANNLAYYSEGSKGAASYVKLVININVRASAAAAHEELLKAARALSVKATGQQLPQSLVEAIKKGAKASQKVGPATINVVRDDWPTGKGYEVQVVIK